MESITRLRQDEALRFMKWLAQNPDNAINIWNIIREDSSDTMVIKGIQDIKDNEFYFMLPFILDSSWLGPKAEIAVSKLKVRRLEKILQFTSMNK